MAQILVRGLDDALVARLKDRARQNHRSLQGEVRTLLEEAAAPLASRSEALAIVDNWQRYWKSRARPSATAQRSSAGCATHDGCPLDCNAPAGWVEDVT